MPLVAEIVEGIPGWPCSGALKYAGVKPQSARTSAPAPWACQDSNLPSKISLLLNTTGKHVISLLDIVMETEPQAA